ncbi:putative purine permease 4 [Sesbania bispinosa]|nr:putative purine permease 4 [Sesbania bispinosa]
MEATSQVQLVCHQSLSMTPSKNNTNEIESIDQETIEEAHPNLPSPVNNKKHLHLDQKSISNKRA